MCSLLTVPANFFFIIAQGQFFKRSSLDFRVCRDYLGGCFRNAPLPTDDKALVINLLHYASQHNFAPHEHGTGLFLRLAQCLVRSECSLNSCEFDLIRWTNTKLTTEVMFIVFLLFKCACQELLTFHKKTFRTFISVYT